MPYWLYTPEMGSQSLISKLLVLTEMESSFTQAMAMWLWLNYNIMLFKPLNRASYLLQISITSDQACGLCFRDAKHASQGRDYVAPLPNHIYVDIFSSVMLIDKI